MKTTNTLQIKNFPAAVNKALKIKSMELGLTFRAYIINVLTKASVV